MNIAIVIPTIEAGGAEKQAVILSKCLAPLHKVWFFVFFGDLPKEQKHLSSLEEAGVELISLEGSTLKKTRRLSVMLRNLEIEAAFNFLTMCDGAGCFAEKKAGVRYIYNGIRSSRMQGWKERIERFCHNHWATATIFNSYCAAEYFGDRGFDRNKMVVIQNCYPEIDDFQLRNDTAVKTVITVGRFDVAKDYETSIKSVAEAYSKHRDFWYVIVGHGALESDVRMWVEKYGINEITDIYINPSNIPELLRKADVFLTTSLYEGTSNAVMEALNASLPVVCTDVGDNRYLVKNGINGFVHKVGDVGAISESLVGLLSDTKLRVSFGLRSNENLKLNFSIESFRNKYLALLAQ